MKTSDFHFDLPERLIAQTPLKHRDASRLLCLGKNGAIRDGHFTDLLTLLSPGDLLVVNNSRVLPARLFGQKEGSGGAMQFLLLEQKERDVWEVMVKPGRKAQPGSRFVFGEGLLHAEVLRTVEGGNRLVKFEYSGNFFELLERVGNVPLPPYITTPLAEGERYQTVYARDPGSAAAPTAGLHFTPELMAALREKGVQFAEVTLHVGPGTFRPVKVEDIERHHMHSEHYHITAETAALLNATRAAGGRVIGVGTTSVRTLESAVSAQGPGGFTECSGSTDIFIYPGYNFRAIDAMITNFHLPESTLIMMICAFAGYDSTMAAYRHAVEQEYRFFSFGDAMYIG